MSDQLTALVEEATKKSGLVWINGRPVWHAWVDGAMVVVGGPGEQSLPGLADGGRAEVTVRSKDKGGRLVSWRASVALLTPDGAAWEATTAELKGKRLNSPHGEGVVEHWARECRVFRLVPEGSPYEYPGTMPDASGAAAPATTPATTRQAAPAALPRLLARRGRRGSSSRP